MDYTSRSQWYNAEISKFLNSDQKETFILLYGREIKHIAKKYQKQLTITPGAHVDIKDERKVCRLAKK